MAKSRWILIATLLLVGISVVFALDDENDADDQSDIPKTIMQAFEASYPGAEIEATEMESVDGKIRYEIDAAIDDVEKTYVYLEDGTLLQTEQEIEEEELPEVVVKAIMTAHKDAEIDEADVITRGAVIEYEVLIEVGEEEMELLVSSDGKVLSSDVISEDEDNDDAPKADDDDNGGDNEDDD